VVCGWFGQQRRLFLYSALNQLLFLSETKCTLFEAGTALLRITYRNFALRGRAMGEAVRRQTATAEARVRSQASSCEAVVDTGALGQVFLTLLQFFLFIIIPPIPNTHLSLNTPSSEGQADEAWEPSNKEIVIFPIKQPT
jgi:hypothetical protein